MKNIVYLDDEAENLRLYKSELEKKQFNVKCLKDPDALIPLLWSREFEPDVVLLDMFFGTNDTKGRGSNC